MGMIVSGSASQALAAALSAEVGRPLAPARYDRFPDGEGLVTIDADLADERVVVVAATVSDTAHLELLQLQDAAREADAAEVVTVLPYMGYARQDTAFEAGQPISARAVARAISTGSDRVIVVNPHEAAVCDFFSTPAEAVDASPLLAGALPGDLDEPLFLGPDENAVTLAAAVRDAHGNGDVDFFEKTRHSAEDVEIAPSDAPVDGRDVVVIDDIVATGSTMSQAIAVLDDRGAARTFVACVHPILAGNARTKLATAGVEAIYGTDTVERPESSVSVAPTLADRL